MIASIAWLPWDHLPKVLQLVPPLLFLLAAGFLRQSGGGAQSGVFAIALLPAFWLARYGGEEFAVLLPACELTRAQLIVDRLRRSIPSDQTCSAGLAQWDGREHPDAVIRRADEALYAAKASGRDRTTVAA